MDCYDLGLTIFPSTSSFDKDRMFDLLKLQDIYCKYRIYSVMRRERILPKLSQVHGSVLYSAIRFFCFQNSPKDLDPSLNCIGMEKCPSYNRRIR